MRKALSSKSNCLTLTYITEGKKKEKKTHYTIVGFSRYIIPLY